MINPVKISWHNSGLSYYFSRVSEMLETVDSEVEFVNQRSRYLVLSAQEMTGKNTEEETRELIETHSGANGENFVVTSMSAKIHPSNISDWTFGLDLCPETWCKSDPDTICPADRAVYESGVHILTFVNKNYFIYTESTTQKL